MLIFYCMTDKTTIDYTHIPTITRPHNHILMITTSQLHNFTISLSPPHNITISQPHDLTTLLPYDLTTSQPHITTTSFAHSTTFYSHPPLLSTPPTLVKSVAAAAKPAEPDNLEPSGRLHPPPQSSSCRRQPRWAHSQGLAPELPQ